MEDFDFKPAALSVNVGASVTWTNNGPTDHNVYFTDGSGSSSNLHKGQSFTFTFTKAGTFNYICTLHPYMTGSVSVK